MKGLVDPRVCGPKRMDIGIDMNGTPSFKARRATLCSGAIAGVMAMVGYTFAVAQTFGAVDLSGAELFERYCAACHGVSATGDGPVAPSLLVQVPDLTQLNARGREFSRFSIREIVDGRSPVVAHGTRRMPVWGREFWFEEGADIEAERRSREIIERLIDYLETIQAE